MTYPRRWKRDFLELEEAIKAFQAKYGWLPGEENVIRLLRHHLNKSREMLHAHVNGGIDEHYQDEADTLARAATASWISNPGDRG